MLAPAKVLAITGHLRPRLLLVFVGEPGAKVKLRKKSELFYSPLGKKDWQFPRMHDRKSR